jgi:hypothetical protein
MQTFPDFMLNIVLAILAPLVTALVAALTFVVRDWHIRRERSENPSDRASDKAGFSSLTMAECLRQVV